MLFRTNIYKETLEWISTQKHENGSKHLFFYIYIYIFISTVCPGYKWSAWDGTFKLTDTFNWDMSDPQTMWAFYTDSPSSLLLTKYKRKKKQKKNNNEKKTKKKTWVLQWSRLESKIHYLHRKQKRYVIFFFFQEKKKEINKTRNVFFFLSTFTAWQIIFNSLMSTPCGQNRLRY